MNCCFIFSGQGSHRPGMGVNLYKNSSVAKSKIDLADSVLDYKISEIMFSDDEETLKNFVKKVNPGGPGWKKFSSNKMKEKWLSLIHI
mgnify:CR=1 FL=1